MAGSPRVVPCDNCDDPISLGPSGWGRCRSCGHETLREAPALDVAKTVYTHWLTFEAPDRPSEGQLRTVAREAIRQGDLFEAEWQASRVRP